MNLTHTTMIESEKPLSPEQEDALTIDEMLDTEDNKKAIGSIQVAKSMEVTVQLARLGIVDLKIDPLNLELWERILFSDVMQQKARKSLGWDNSYDLSFSVYSKIVDILNN